MYQYMNTKSFKILAILFTLTICTGIASADVSNLQVQGDPVNNSGAIYALGSNNDGLDGTLNDDTISFNLTQNGNYLGTTGVGLKTNANNNESPTEFNITLKMSDFTNGDFVDGDVNLSAEQTGASNGGFQTVEDSVNFTGDISSPPAPSTSNPEKLAGGGINFTFDSVSDNGPGTVVSYRVFRKNDSDASSSYNFIESVSETVDSSYEYRDTSLTHGDTYSYKVKAVDSAENYGDLSTPGVSTTSDGEGPTVVDGSSNPANESYTSDQSSVISFDLSDGVSNVDQSTLRINVTDTDGTDELSNADVDNDHVTYSSGTVSIDPTAGSGFTLNEGEVDVNVNVKDSVGNLGEGYLTFTVDTSEPSVDVTNPVDGEEVTAQNMIEGTYDDDNEIDFVEIRIQNSTGGSWSEGGDFIDSENWIRIDNPQDGTWSYDSSGITSDGSYTVYVEATDKAGNLGGISETVTYTIDTGAPDISSAYVNDTDFDGSSDEIRVTFTEYIDDDSANSESFLIDKGTLGNVGTAESIDDEKIRIPISGIDTGVRPNLTMLNGTVKDAAGNNLSVNSSIVVEDKARPVLMNARIDSENSSAGTTVVRMDFSENISDPVDELSLGVEGVLSINDNYSDILTADYQLSGSPGVLQTGNSPNITGLGSVEDAAGNPAVLQSNQNITISTFRKEFVNGWNFFSVPIADTSTAEITEVFTQSQLNSIDTIWRYRRGNWSSYTENKGDDSDFTVLRGGEGYLVKTSSGFTITPNVNNKVATKGIGSFDMDSGWNLVGHFQEFDQPADNTDSGAFDSLGYDFSLAGQEDAGEVAAAVVPVEAEVGSAYWVNPFTELNPQSDYVENRESQ